jgi:hypothetical protein
VSGWTAEELDRIGTADELELAPARRDGTLRKPVPVWVVRDGDGLYVRSWRGTAGAWYRAVRANGEGHVSAGGVDKDVVFVAADEAVDDALDAEYRSKYGRYGDSYVGPMTAPDARSTTLELRPREQAR